jgi:hypothetical protein
MAANLNMEQKHVVFSFTSHNCYFLQVVALDIKRGKACSAMQARKLSAPQYINQICQHHYKRVHVCTCIYARTDSIYINIYDPDTYQLYPYHPPPHLDRLLGWTTRVSSRTQWRRDASTWSADGSANSTETGFSANVRVLYL